MPELKLGPKTYHLVKRVVVSLELREASDSHAVIAQGESVCRAGDKFDERLGTVLAFKRLMHNLFMTWRPNLHWEFPREVRSAAWEQFWSWDLASPPRKEGKREEGKRWLVTGKN